MFRQPALWGGIVLLVTALLLVATGCEKLKGSISSNKYPTELQAGMNYLQPIKWRVTYNYRVQNIQADFPTTRKRQAAYDPSIPVVGEGTYEVWMIPPCEGESVRNVECVYSSIEPTEITQTESGDTTFYYYDFAPDGYLPCEISAQVTWEFVTLERYVHWEGMEWGDYDTNSSEYKHYTALESPISTNPRMQATAAKFKRSHPDDLLSFTLDCYNEIVENFYYDYSQPWVVNNSGQVALQPAGIAWDNQTGVCDEFASVFCSLMRSQGIPARPVAGYSHSTPFLNTAESSQLDLVALQGIEAAQGKYGPLLTFGLHAWAEFYVPEVGWIPVDPTWGVYAQPIDRFTSYMGNKRQIPVADYYFGKLDPYRIAISKEWNLKLNPPPKPKGVDPQDTFIVAATERASGIRQLHRGWTANSGGIAFADERSNTTRRTGIMEDPWGKNWDVETQCLGPVDPATIPDVLAAIEAEGSHYISVPKLPGEYPFYTSGISVHQEIADRIQRVTGIAPVIPSEVCDSERGGGG